MASIFSQIWAVALMNIQSMKQRISISLAAIFAISVVVAVLLSFLSMAKGFEKTLAGTGSESTAIVTAKGSRSELNSNLSRDVVNILSAAPGIAKNANGQSIYSAELFVIVDGIKKSSQTEVNLPLRGISFAGFELREQVNIIAGRMFEEGKNEIMVGKGVTQEFSGFELNKDIKFGKTTWRVVGIFSTGGSAFESELWADAKMVQVQFQRGSSFQTVRLKLEESGEIQAIKEFIENDPRLILDVQTEAEFFSEQGDALKTMVYFGWILSIVMSLGALAGALNTMYTSVSTREAEIATLRAIGFSNLSAFMGTLLESIILSLIGGIIGVLISYSFMDGITTSSLSSNFTQLVFTFKLTPDLFLNGITLALIIGLVGGFFPAWRAARLPVMIAFRSGK